MVIEEKLSHSSIETIKEICLYKIPVIEKNFSMVFLGIIALARVFLQKSNQYQ